jgi:hypothetical protein
MCIVLWQRTLNGDSASYVSGGQNRFVAGPWKILGLQNSRCRCESDSGLKMEILAYRATGACAPCLTNITVDEVWNKTLALITNELNGRDVRAERNR